MSNDELEEAMLDLMDEVRELRRLLYGFTPVTVDLRINGVVRPVVLFDKNDEQKSPFSVVEE